MWVAAPSMPVYSTDRGTRRKTAKTHSPAASSVSSPLGPLSPSQPPSSVVAALHHPNSITDLLEPAIDGPPSPESIRALSKQMKRASFLEKHHSQQTASSGSSSLRSHASADRRPSWEHAMDSITLSRKSSGRSTASSLQPRERPESVQLFGKTFFSRRGRVKRDSQSNSSGSSMYSAEMSFETGPPPTSAPIRDTFIPGFFNRRRTLKPEVEAEESAARRKFQISGPYNFQHLTHTQREHVPNLQRGSRMALQSDLSAARASQLPTDGTLRGIPAESLHFADFSSETLPLGDDAAGVYGELHTRISLTRPLAFRHHTSPPRQLKHSRSQELLRIPPPRPPRSPMEPAFVAAPPVPPPRISSRVSIRYDGYDPLASTTLDRPRTSGGFRPPAPLALVEDPTSPRSHAYSRSTDLDMAAEHRYSRLMSPVIPDDSNWPLPCAVTPSYERALPDVPEEEEHHQLVRKSRISIASNNSSLRGSQSVPLLRQMAQSQANMPQRPLSGGSDTLGRMDLLAAQRALRAGLQDADATSPPRESWEDDIDYCYDHEAEADCEYAWDRPSMDLCRDEDSTTPVGMARAMSVGGISPAMLTPGHFDMPALSPASQVSTSSQHEAITPTAGAMPRSNFSLPRPDARRFSHRPPHIRTTSHASSFKESHGFTLSPTLLIPASGYHEAMLADESDELSGPEDFPQYEEPTLTMNTSTLLVHARNSASTTGSGGSDNSGSERHISTTSTSTDMTRLTLDIEDVIPKTDSAMAVSPIVDSPTAASPLVVSPVVPEPEPQHMRGKSEPMAVLMEEPPESPVVHRSFSRNSEPNNRLARKSKDDSATKSPKLKEGGFFRRQRARTTSTSTPPLVQSSFFPSI